MLKNLTVILIIMLPAMSPARAQTHSIKGGYGNFEGFNIGISHRTKKLILGYGIGSDFNMFGQGFYNCAFGNIGRPLMKVRENGLISLHGAMTIWNMENTSNIFSAVAFSPQLRYTHVLNSTYSLSGHIGYTYSSVFRYERKNYYEIGWPREWLPDFGVSLQYCLSCK